MKQLGTKPGSPIVLKRLNKTEAMIERGGLDLFHAGDKVAHPGHGGCTISETCIQKRGGEPVEYLVLIPENDPGVRIMVPVQNADKVGLRKTISPDTADQLLDAFSGEDTDTVYENNFTKRRQAYQDILRNGSLEALVAMIQELRHQPKLSSGDQEMLPRAQRKLFSEIALAKGMEFEQVLEIADLRMHPAGH